jgi:hypothetical protein
VANREGKEGLIAKKLTRTLEVSAEEVTSASVAEEVLLSDSEVRGVSSSSGTARDEVSVIKELDALLAKSEYLSHKAFSCEYVFGSQS